MNASHPERLILAGVGLGLALGGGFALLLHNLRVGVELGLAVGLIIGLVLTERAKK